MAKVVRIVGRLNIGGPAIHTILLSHYLEPEYQTVLVSGFETEREGNMLPLADSLGVPVIRMPELGREIHPLRDLVSLAQLVRLIAREKPDIVHTHTAKAGMVGRLAARLCRVPVVLHTFHGHVFRGYFGPMKSGFFVRLERRLARLTDVILTVNEEQRQELLSFRIAPPDKIQAMRLGLQLEPLARGAGDRQGMREKWGLGAASGPVIGIVARLVPVKDHELFLQAAALLRQAHPDASFVIVGDGERRDALEKRAHDLGLPVVFTGWERDLPSVYAALDVVCLTSLNEGSPVALIEALAAAKPVVATAAGGVPDVIHDGDNGLLVHDREPATFCRAVDRLLVDPALATELGRRGRESAYPRYDVSRLADDMRVLYRKLAPGAEKSGRKG